MNLPNNALMSEDDEKWTFTPTSSCPCLTHMLYSQKTYVDILRGHIDPSSKAVLKVQKVQMIMNHWHLDAGRKMSCKDEIFFADSVKLRISNWKRTIWIKHP